MELTISDDFSLSKIAESEQCFRIRRFDDAIYRFITECGMEDPFPAYGGAAGIMQQYVFYYALNHKRELKLG